MFPVNQDAPQDAIYSIKQNKCLKDRDICAILVQRIICNPHIVLYSIMGGKDQIIERKDKKIVRNGYGSENAAQKKYKNKRGQ